MQLSEMQNTNYKRMNKIFESRFGFQIDFDSLTLKKAKSISMALSEALSAIRNSSSFHTSHTDPRYTEILLCKQSLTEWMSQKRKVITEGEVGQAETLLAARDIVDSIQQMLEKIGKLQNEQMPALTDSIRDQIGNEQAEAFKSTVTALLANLGQQITTSRDQADAAVRALTGEESSMPASDVDTTGAEGAEVAGDDVGQDDFAASDAAAGGSSSAGREMRS